MNDNFSLINKIELFKGFVPSENLIGVPYSSNKRLSFMERFKSFIKHGGNVDRLIHLERVDVLKRLEQIVNLQLTDNLDSISKTYRLEKNLYLSNQDWKQFYKWLPDRILKNCFIYCDPPYEDTKQYQEGKNFDHDEFWEWFRNCPYPVYASSYKAPRDIQPINFELKNQLLDNGKRGVNYKPKKVVRENIYWNGKGEPAETLILLKK